VVDPRVTELHCIMPIANLVSVMNHGILSHERAAKRPHHSVALQPVQDKRDQKQVPGGLKLHQYANLYFHARNPMMYKRRGEAPNLCILRVSTMVLARPGAVISDQNAASDYVRFLHPRHWQVLDFDAIYAMDWRHQNDPVAYYRHSSQKCAEVLVPQRVETQYLTRRRRCGEGSHRRAWIGSAGHNESRAILPLRESFRRCSRR
jgi:ssDNA thymidine ADP-ribosyltransferase, DarT